MRNVSIDSYEHSSVFNIRREFSQLVPDHILRYGDVEIVLPIVNLKLETDEVR